MLLSLRRDVTGVAARAESRKVSSSRQVSNSFFMKGIEGAG